MPQPTKGSTSKSLEQLLEGFGILQQWQAGLGDLTPAFWFRGRQLWIERWVVRRGPPHGPLGVLPGGRASWWLTASFNTQIRILTSALRGQCVGVAQWVSGDRHKGSSSYNFKISTGWGTHTIYVQTTYPCAFQQLSLWLRFFLNKGGGRTFHKLGWFQFRWHLVLV